MKTTLAISFGSLSVLISQIPAATQKQMLAILILFIMDTITGVYLAGKRKQISSQSMGEMLKAKFTIHASVLALSGVMLLVTSSMVYLDMALLGIIAAESISLIENLSGIRKETGISFGYLDGFLNAVEKNLSVVNGLAGALSQKKLPDMSDLTEEELQKVQDNIKKAIEEELNKRL